MFQNRKLIFLATFFTAAITYFVYHSFYQKNEIVLSENPLETYPLDINYSYQNNAIRVPFELMFGEMPYEEWFKKERNNILKTIEVSSQTLPQPKWKKTNVSHTNGNDVITFSVEYDFGIESNKKDDFGFFLVLPRSKKLQGIVVAIHGHEEPYRGKLPISMLEKEHWAMQFPAAGYATLIPSHLFYESAKQLYKIKAFHYIWARYVRDTLKIAQSMLPRSTPVFATGVSSGCTTAMLITVLNQDIRSFSGGACTSPLSYLREFYRIINHPNQWDFPEFEDELPLLALGASKNFQFQIGTRDVLYPNGEKWVTDSKQIITQRDILVSELAGLILGAQKIFTKSNLGGSVNLAAHNLGHTLDPEISLEFFKNQKNNATPLNSKK